MAHVQFCEARDLRHPAPFLSRVVLLAISTVDAVGDTLRDLVHRAGDTIGLRQNFCSAGQVDELLYVGSSPSIDGLVVISRAIHALRLFVENVCDVPLERRQVLRLIEEGQLKMRAALVGVRNKLTQHIREVVHLEFFFVGRNTLVNIFYKVPISVQVAIVILVSQLGLL